MGGKNSNISISYNFEKQGHIINTLTDIACRNRKSVAKVAMEAIEQYVERERAVEPADSKVSCLAGTIQNSTSASDNIEIFLKGLLDTDKILLLRYIRRGPENQAAMSKLNGKLHSVLFVNHIPRTAVLDDEWKSVWKEVMGVNEDMVITQEIRDQVASFARLPDLDLTPEQLKLRYLIREVTTR